MLRKAALISPLVSMTIRLAFIGKQMFQSRVGQSLGGGSLRALRQRVLQAICKKSAHGFVVLCRYHDANHTIMARHPNGFALDAVPQFAAMSLGLVGADGLHGLSPSGYRSF